MIQPSVRLWVSAFITIITLAVIIPGTTLIGLSGYNLYKNYLTVSPEENSKELIRTFPDDFPAVLAATDDNTTPQINFRAVSLFSKKTYFDDNIEAPGKQLNLGDGTIIASNVIYSLTAGQGITITGGQTPTISATTPTYTAGDGITIDGATIANDDKGSAQNIFKNIAIAGQNDITADSNIDTLTLIAGTGITLTSNAANDAITISAPPIITGWTTSGANVYLSTVSDNVGIGTASPTAKLEVIGSTIISSNLTLGGNFILSGDTISDITGSGLSLTGTTLGIALTTTGSTGATASNSGLEVSASGLTLLKGCQTGELLKWNDSLSQWECATDTGGTSGIINVEENDTLISASAGTLDFLGADFILTEAPTGEINVSIDYPNSLIVRSNQNETITGNWTFNNAISAPTALNTINGLIINAGALSGVTGYTQNTGNFTINGSGTISLGTGTNNITIGNGTGTFSLNSNALDISTAGAITGATGITGARTITGTTSLDVWSNTITNQTSSGIQRGLVLINANDPANAVTESLITIDNAETTASTVTDAIIITSSGVNGGIIDAIDVSDSNITNALNAGANFITLDGLRFFEGTTGTFTFEDTAGNDFFTITDNGTSGTIAITNTGFLDLAAITHATTALMGLRLPQANTLSNPTSGEGFLAWDADDNILMIYNGSNWENVSGTTLQQAYTNDTDGSDTIILLNSADDSIIVRNPASSGTDSGYILSLDQLNTGAIDGLRVTNAGTGTGATFSLTNASGTRSAGLRIEQTGVGTTTDGIIIAETAGTITNGLTIGTGVGTAIVLQQGESIDNTTNNQINMTLGTAGTLLLTSTTSATIANSAGSLIIDSAGGTVVINDATIDISNQATDFEIRDNSTTAMTISQATNNYLIINTHDTNTAVTLDLPVAGSSSTTANLFTSNIAKTINIGTGTGADTINIGTGATSADTITMGNTSVATTMTFNSGATTTNAVTFNLNSITTATAFEISLDGITSGTGLLLDDATAAGLSSGTMLQIQSITTDTTAITDGMLAYLDWSPTTATTKVGDLFRINIGSNGNVTNLFNITDNGSSLFAVSETAITSAVPHSFTAPGDVAIAYDMQFTNQTASYIKSNAPLYIEAGEAFEANHLTLRTFNTGQIVIDGTLNGTTVVSNTTSSAAGTVTVSGRGLIYYLHDNSGTTNSSYTTTINITGLPAVEGSIAFIRSGCQKGATTGSQTHTCTIQVNGTTISSVATATGTGASTVIENYVAAYINGSWRLIVGSNTSSDTADLAEIYKAESDVDAGELVALTDDEDLKVKRATKNDGTKVLGVTSTEPAILIGDEFGAEQRRIAVALAGRVPVKVKTENGNIKKGDFITISSTPGVGMKATEPGMVVGKALTAYENPDPQAIGTIIIFIQNTYYSPITTQLAKPKDLTPDALSSTAIPYLLVSGLAEISDLTVTGQFLAGNLSITGMASQGGADIATLTGPLRLQPDAANNVEIMGGKVIIDTQGNIIADEGTLSIKTVTAKKINIDNTNSQDASLGTATINAWKTRVIITTTAVNQNSQIFLTAKSKTRLPLSVTEIKAGESFTVEIPEDQEEDLTFSWWIVN